MRVRTALVAILVPAAVAGAAAVPQGHPHFDDGGALQWFTRLDAAKAAAKKADKVILVEFGREG